MAYIVDPLVMGYVEGEQEDPSPTFDEHIEEAPGILTKS
jgi:hypothetical protein